VSAFPDLPSDLVARSKDPFYLLNAILLQACENTPELRYSSAAALHAALLDLKQKLSGNILHHEH